jgi:hypothetical protein
VLERRVAVLDQADVHLEQRSALGTTRMFSARAAAATCWRWLRRGWL